MKMISQKNKILFLFHIFVIGLTGSLFFIGIGKLLIDKLNLLIGASLLFALNEFSKILFQFIFSTIDKKFSIKKSIIISELLQSISLIFIVIFKFYSLTALIAILIILNFFESFFLISEFNLMLKISQKEDRKKYENENTKLELCDNLQKIIDKYKNSEEEIFIIGGGEIYKKALEMEIVKRIYMSHVNFSDKNADTYFPKIDLKKWVVITKENYDGWRFCIYEKISG